MPAQRLREIISRIKADQALERVDERNLIEALEEIANEIEALQAEISELRAELSNGGKASH